MMKFIQFCVLMIFVAYSYADANLQKFACDGKIMELECKSGGFLIIMNATFGRVSNNICPDKTLVDFITCRAENTYDKVKALCNGKQRCTINATNTYFGDACPTLSKYLEVQYKCRNVGSIDIDDEQSSSQTTTTTTEEPDISIEIETRPPNLGPAVLVNPAYVTTSKPTRVRGTLPVPAPVPIPAPNYHSIRHIGFQSNPFNRGPQYQMPQLNPIVPAASLLPLLPLLPLAPLLG